MSNGAKRPRRAAASRAGRGASPPIETLCADQYARDLVRDFGQAAEEMVSRFPKSLPI